jgi:TonB-dependent starch-binding outer membrane protein SusC
MNRFLSLIAFWLLASVLYGQQITGKVTDAQGDPLPGVSIQLLGTTSGTITDLNGMYKITVTEGTLKFSFIGFITQEIPVTNQTTIDVVLLENTQTLGEVVVIGYGTQKKKDLTTAVSIVGEKELQDRRIISAAEGLQGKAAGVQVTSPSGKPGVDMSVRVRGSTSVIAGNEPLYVVDGVPTTDIRGLNPNDIASMSVLKDASSAAIYGARAANGVVLITTHRGKADEEPVLRFNTYFGISRLRKTVDVLGTFEYRKMMNEISPGNYDPSWTADHNWSDSVFSTGFSQSYQFSYGGGTEKSQYFLSAGYLSDEGIVKPARFDRYSVRLNLDNELKSWLKMGTSINVLHLRTKDTPDNLSSGRGGVIMSTLNTPPFLDVYKDDGSGQYAPNPFQPSWENPIAYMYGPDQETTDNRLFGSIYAEIKLFEGLKFKTNFGLDQNNHAWDYYLDNYRTSYGRDQNGIGRSDKRNSTTWLWENTLNYDKSIENHHFNALIGSSIQKYTTNDTYIYGNDFPDDVSVKTINAANTVNGSTTREEWALASFFGRVSYDYNYKYYLTVSCREDGSSKLANHWGTMPSFSAGWRISSEPFMKSVTFINDLKLRGGWGVNGNQEGIDPYAAYGLITYYHVTPGDTLSGPGSYQYTYGNPDLKWETTNQTNIGIDLSMFNSRLSLVVDAYYKKTSDVILNVQLPNYLPITFIQTNAADIVNKGIEFSINSVILDKKFKWILDYNMSFNRNEVTALKFPGIYTFGPIYSNNSDVSILEVGKPIGTFYGYVSEGVNPETGDMIYKDVNNNGIAFHDGIFDTGDRTVIGNAQPDFTFGFTNDLKYHRFDLNIFFQGSYGNDIFNATRVDLEGMFDSKNQSVDVVNRWTPDNTITDIPRAVGGGNVDNVMNSTRFVEDGSYIRLKSVTLSYDIFKETDQNKGFRTFSVFITGQNLLTFTKYSGFDPEVNAFGNDTNAEEKNAALGIDYGTYPQSITLLVGLNVEF